MNLLIQEKYKIRDYHKDDFEKLINLWKETGIFHPERQDDHESIEGCRQHGGMLLVLTDLTNNLLIGSSWMTIDGRRLYLHHFCIAPDYQGKGLGMELGYASLDFIKKKGLQVKIEVHKENHRAKRLYEKLGFFSYTDYDIYMRRVV